MHRFALELLSSITPQYHVSPSDTLKGNEPLVVFPFIVHKSNTHIIYRLPAHENSNIPWADASVQIHEEVPNVSRSLR